MIRICETRIEVALGEMHTGVSVGMLITRRHTLVRPRLGVQDGGVRRHRVLRLNDGRQLFIFNVNEADGLLRDVLIVGHDCRDFVANKHHAIPRQQRHVLNHRPGQDVLDVLSGQNKMHSGHRACGGRVDRNDSRVWEWAAENLHPQHARHLGIESVDRRAGHLFRPIDARNRLTDQLWTATLGS